MTRIEFAERIVRILRSKKEEAKIDGPFVKTEAKALGGSVLAEIDVLADKARMGWVITTDAAGNLQILY